MSANNNLKIAQEIVDSYEARIRVIQGVAEETKSLLEEFKHRRERMSQELKAALAKHESLRGKGFDKMMEDILITQKNREDKVNQMLADFQDQEMTVVENLRAMLQKGEKLRLKDFKKTLAKIRGEQDIRQQETPHQISQELTHMQSEVKAMLENFKKEREKVATEWQTMVEQMAQVRRLN